MPLALIALSLGAFAIGTTEFVTVGLIPSVSSDMNVSVATAGLIVSSYAVGVAVGAPILTALTASFPRKPLLIGLMLLFTIGNLFAWWAPNFDTLLAARVVTGLAHGVFFSVGSVIAANLVPREKASSAIAIMFSGLTLAFVTGVPLGTLIGQYFGWRTTFLVVSSLGLIAMGGAMALIPRNIPHTPEPITLQKVQALLSPRLLLVYAMTAIGYGGSLIAFTYLAPILEEISGFRSAFVGAILILYGASVAVGNIWGGRLADKHGPIFSLVVIFTLLSVNLFAISFTAHFKYLMLLNVMTWGAVAFGNVPALQIYVVRQAERFAPTSVGIASGLNISAFNLGVAGGSFAGGEIVDRSGLLETAWIAALVVVVALGLTIFSGWLDRRSTVQKALIAT